MASQDSVLQRLDDQIAWYDQRSLYCQRAYKALKFIEIVAAASIPFLTGFSVPSFVTGGIGVLIVVLEGILQLNQYHDRWISYRSTCEALKHEKFLHTANAGPYAGAAGARALLAERVESLISEEHAKWIALHEPTKRGPGTEGAGHAGGT